MTSFAKHHPTDPLGPPRNRECQILQLVARARAQRTSPRRYFCHKTTDTYRSRFMQKLDISDIAGLVKFAIACGLTSP